MEGGGSSGSGRVMPKAKGTGGHHGIWQSRLGPLPKDPGRQGPGQGEIPPTPQKGPSKRGGWDGTLQRRIAWSNIMQTDFHRVRFFVQAVYDALPSPANLHLWGKSKTLSRLLYSGRGSLECLFNGCPKAFVDRCNCWYHDQVLKAVAENIASAIFPRKHHHTTKKAITFVKAGEKPRPQPKTTTKRLLYTADDRQLQADLGEQLKFPQYITMTKLQPDMIITPEASKQLIMLELTLPWEERINKTNKRKCVKY